MSSYPLDQIIPFSVLVAVAGLASQVLLSSSSTVLVAVSGVLAFMAVLVLFLELPVFIERAALPPGSSGYPILGHFLFYTKNPRDFYLKYTKKFGSFCTVNYLLKPQVLIADDDDMRWLVREDRKGNLTPSAVSHIVSLLGPNSILMTRGKRHRMLRRMLEPAFNPAAVACHASTLNDWQLEEWSSDDFHDLGVIKSAALKIFFTCVFGEEVDPEILNPLFSYFGDWLRAFSSVPIKLPGTIFTKGMQARARLMEAMQDMIRAFQAKYPKESDSGKTTLIGRLCYGKDEDGSELTLHDQAEILLMLVFAAHDTTHATIGNLFHHMAAQPDLVEKIREEVKNIDLSNPDELKAAPLLNSFLFESWRLDPPVNGAQRELLVPVEYKGYKFPRGTRFGMQYQLSSFNEMRYPKPHEFRIERHLPLDHPLLSDKAMSVDDVDPNKVSSSYRIFGCGSHSCIGQHFARLEVRILFARVVRDYVLATRNETLVPFLIWHWRSQFRLKKRLDDE